MHDCFQTRRKSIAKGKKKKKKKKKRKGGKKILGQGNDAIIR
jgi:hypothetical protein